MGSLNFNDGNYVGEVANGVPHGKGKLTKSNYDYFVGIFQNGKFIRGKARITFEDKSVYKGEIKHGRLEGNGTIYSYSKVYHFYKGEFLNGLPHGKGAMGFGSYDRCVGEFRNGEFVNGKVKYVCYAKDCTYKGTIVNKAPDGTGAFVIHIGGYRTYKGELKHGLPHGNGTMKIGYDRCVGEFRNGEFVNGTAKMDLAKVRTFFPDRTNVGVVSMFTYKAFPILVTMQEGVVYRNGDLVRNNGFF